VISALSVSVIPHLVHPRKAVALPERIPPSASGIWGAALGKCPILQTLLGQQFSMLRAAGLHLLLGGTQRFSAASHPAALVACHVAPWHLYLPSL
jgi:hypothetical protein